MGPRDPIFGVPRGYPRKGPKKPKKVEKLKKVTYVRPRYMFFLGKMQKNLSLIRGRGGGGTPFLTPFWGSPGVPPGGGPTPRFGPQKGAPGGRVSNDRFRPRPPEKVPPTTVGRDFRAPAYFGRGITQVRPRTRNTETRRYRRHACGAKNPPVTR